MNNHVYMKFFFFFYISRLRFDNVPLRQTHVGHGRQPNTKLVDRVQLREKTNVALQEIVLI